MVTLSLLSTQRGLVPSMSLSKVQRLLCLKVLDQSVFLFKGKCRKEIILGLTYGLMAAQFNFN